MTPFPRQPAPAFWADKERRWQAVLPDRGRRDPLRQWRHEKVSLAARFHDTVREVSEPRACAYCDGSLTETSRETIDHFLPEHAFPELALSWDNLFPACDRCNSTYKGTRWSCRLVRPDTDPVEDLFDFDEQTGRLRPRAALGWPMRVNVRLTIRVFRLNEGARCRARQRVWRTMFLATENASISADYASDGPYRFVARKAAKAMAAIRAALEGKSGGEARKGAEP